MAGSVGHTRDESAATTNPCPNPLQLNKRETMPKEFLKRWMPAPETLRDHKHLRLFARWLGEPNLWQLNRRSAAGAFAVGLCIAWVPVPFQMVLAAGLAILCRVNLPISVALVWVTNPLTMPPMFYFAYYVGVHLLGMPPVDFELSFSWEWLRSVMSTIGTPFLLGCAVMAICSSSCGYLAIRLLWRYSIIRKMAHRRQLTNSRQP